MAACLLVGLTAPVHAQGAPQGGPQGAPQGGPQGAPQAARTSPVSANVQVSAVSVGGTRAALLRPAKPRGSVILLNGGPGRVDVAADGNIGAGRLNQLIRTRHDYAARGLAVLVPDVGYDLAALVEFMGTIKRPVTVVGTSRGTQRAARGIAAGARPDRLVLTAGFLSHASGDGDNVMTILRTPARLPPTLVVHHREDACGKTRPQGVQPFLGWAEGRAKVRWLSGGTPEGDPCQSFGTHGFHGIDAQVVQAVAGFALR